MRTGCTVKVVVQVALFPAASVAVTVIVCEPTPTNDPAAGFWLTVMAIAALQLSLTVTPPNTSGTAAWHAPLALALEAGGQLRLGGVVSVAVKLAQLVTLLHGPVTTTQYVPSLVAVTELRLSVSLVAPGRSTPSLLH
jgi:hypothetical protein